MTNCQMHVKVSAKKQDNRSGKERQCCRYIQTALWIFTARMIFAGFICLQNWNLKALIRHAFRGPDQVDVWDQVHLYALWNEQTGNSELLKPPLVRKDRRFFYAIAMSHAQPGWQAGCESLLSGDRMTDWVHTANAATVSSLWLRTCRHGSLWERQEKSLWITICMIVALT